MHEHYDADNNLTGRTVITRESAWDDASRERALALQLYENGMCKCGCGLPASEAYTKQPFKIDHFTCHAGRAIAQQRRNDEKQAKEDKLKDGWDDGRHYYAEPVKGGDDG